jgi:hypothetical protein
MNRRTRAAANRTASTARRPVGFSAAARRWGALAVVCVLTSLPVRAQQPAAPAPTVLPPPQPVESAVAPPAPAPGTVVPASVAESLVPAPAPAPGFGPPPPDLPAVETHCGVFAETGPYFPVGGSLEPNLKAGWAVAAGLREWRDCGNWTLFADLAGEYITYGTKPVVKETNEDLFFPNGNIRTINFFNLTNLTSFSETGVRGSVGWDYYPSYFNGSAGDPRNGRVVYWTGRLGFRGGVNNAGFDQFPTPAGLIVLHAFEKDQGFSGRRARLIKFVDTVERSEPYWGPFTTLGLGVKWNDAHVGNLRLGCVRFTAEVEFSYEQTDLGMYRHDASIISVEPTFSLSISF